MGPTLLASIVFASAGGGFIGYALFNLVTGGRVRPAVEAALVGLGTVLIGLSIHAPAPLAMALLCGGGAVAASGSLLHVRRRLTRLAAPDEERHLLP